MSTIDTTNIIVGNSGNQSQNLKITGNNDGTFTIGRADGSQTIMTVDGSGNTKPTVGMVVPSYTTTQKNALTPIAGMVIIDTTLSKVCIYTGAAWQTVTSA